MRLVVLCLGGASAFGLLALPCLAQPAPDPAVSASDPAAATPVVALHDPAPAIAPLTLRARARYTAVRAFSPENFALGIFTSGIQTWRDRPEAWGRDWEGFAQRFGSTLEQVYGKSISTLQRRGLLETAAGTLRLTQQGRLLGNQVFMEFV